MLWVYSSYKYFYFYSAGINFRRQNLTYTDVRFLTYKGDPRTVRVLTPAMFAEHGNRAVCPLAAPQRQTLVNAYFSSKQLPPFAFCASQDRSNTTRSAPDSADPSQSSNPGPAPSISTTYYSATGRADRNLIGHLATCRVSNTPVLECSGVDRSD